MQLQENLGGEVGKGVLTGRGRFCNCARTDGEETLVRGRRSDRGGRRSGCGGAPWLHRACCEVGGVGEQSEWVVASEALVEEDNNGEIPWPGFAGQRCGQALGAGGHGDEAFLLAQSDSSGRLINVEQR
jgi:hypothetical protein